MSDKRWRVTIVEREQFYRRPRTKKRRILKKWRARKENYRPLMVPVMQSFCFGALAAKGLKPSPYWDAETPGETRMLEMTTALWEKVKRDVPEFAQKCDLFRRVKSLKIGEDAEYDLEIPAYQYRDEP